MPAEAGATDVIRGIEEIGVWGRKWRARLLSGFQMAA